MNDVIINDRQWEELNLQILWSVSAKDKIVEVVSLPLSGTLLPSVSGIGL